MRVKKNVSISRRSYYVVQIFLVIAILGCLPTWVPVLSGHAAGYYRWDLWQMKPWEGILDQSVITEDDEQNEGFSACILTMDDNVLWPE